MQRFPKRTTPGIATGSWRPKRMAAAVPLSKNGKNGTHALLRRKTLFDNTSVSLGVGNHSHCRALIAPSQQGIPRPAQR